MKVLLITIMLSCPVYVGLLSSLYCTSVAHLPFSDTHYFGLYLQHLQSELTSSSSALCEILQSSYTTVFSCPPVVIPDEAMVVDGALNLCNTGYITAPTLSSIKISPKTLFLAPKARWQPLSSLS